MAEFIHRSRMYKFKVRSKTETSIKAFKRHSKTSHYQSPSTNAPQYVDAKVPRRSE